MAAAAVCLARGVEPAAVRAGLASFRGVAHRLEEVAELGGVLYVNDSKATNVASTLVALDAFAAARGPPDPRRPGQGPGLRGPARGGRRRRARGVYLIGEDAATIAAALRSVAPPVPTAATWSGRSRRRARRRRRRRAGAGGGGRSCCSRRRARASTSSRTSKRAASAFASSSTEWRLGRSRVEAARMPSAAAGARARRRAARPQRKRGRGRGLAAAKPTARAADPAHRDALPAGVRRGDGLQRLLGDALLQGSGNGSGYLVRFVVYGAVGLVVMQVLARDGVEKVAALTGRCWRPRSCSCSRCTSRTSASASTARSAGSGPGRSSSSPSELMKLALVLYGATLLAKRPQRVHDLRELLKPLLFVVAAAHACSSPRSRTSAPRW